MDLKKYLRENGIWHNFIAKSKESGHTVESAQLAGVDPNRLSKSLVLLDEEKNAYLIIIPGTCKMDFGKVRKAFDIKKLHLCPFDEAKDYSGYEPGETPPIHHLKEMKVGFSQLPGLYPDQYKIPV